MQITILGSGTFIPTKKQKSSSYLIKIDNEYILLDCGCGALQRMLDLNFKWQKINNIFISHTHPDHVNDLFTAIHSQALSRKKPLKIYGPKNIKKLGRFIGEEMMGHCRPPLFTFHNITSKKLKIKKITIETIPVKHHPLIPTIAYKFKVNKKVMVYSGDIGTLINKNKFIKFCQEADLLIADSGAPPGPAFSDHFNPYQIGEIAQKAKVKKLVLTHQTIKSESAIINDCKKSYSGKIVVAKDLMKIKI